MSKPTKFTKGERIETIHELLDLLTAEKWVYYGNRPKHPSVILSMTASTLLDAIKRGSYFVAEETTERECCPGCGKPIKRLDVLDEIDLICSSCGVVIHWQGSTPWIDDQEGTTEHKGEFIRHNKYEVIKVDDIYRYLVASEREQLNHLINLIHKGRRGDGEVPCNRYVVVNEDQPYAEKVWQLIQEHWEANQ